MPRRLLAINVILACVAILCVALIVKQLATSRPPARHGYMFSTATATSVSTLRS